MNSRSGGGGGGGGSSVVMVVMVIMVDWSMIGPPGPKVEV